MRGELVAAMRTKQLAWPAIPQLLGSKPDLPPSCYGHFSLSPMKSHSSDEVTGLPPDGCWLIAGDMSKSHLKKLLKSGKHAACSLGSLSGALCLVSSSSISPHFLIPLGERGGNTTGIWTLVPLMRRKWESNCLLDLQVFLSQVFLITRRSYVWLLVQ